MFKLLYLFVFAGDNDAARNIKAIKNGELLYDSERILACSVLIKDDIFFTGIVSAAMKNKVSCTCTWYFRKKISFLLAKNLLSDTCNILCIEQTPST